MAKNETPRMLTDKTEKKEDFSSTTDRLGPFRILSQEAQLALQSDMSNPHWNPGKESRGKTKNFNLN